MWKIRSDDRGTCRTHRRNFLFRVVRHIPWAFLLLMVSFIGRVIAQYTPAVDWWAIDKAVVEHLFTEDLGSMARSLAEAPASGHAAELMRRLSILVRAGHRQRAAAAIDRLAEAVDLPDTSELSHIANFLIDRQEWDLTRRFLERVPQAEPGLGYVFIKQWAEKGDHREIDRWLAERIKANAAYWLRERLRFRTTLGTEAELLNELAADVRAHPADLARAERYIDAVSTVGKEINVNWMGKVCKPRLAYESYKLGQAVASHSPQSAIALFERSLAMPFTEQDQKLVDEEIRHRMAAFIPPQSWERDLRLWTKTALAQSYKANGQADQAQPLIEELAAANKDGLPHVSWSQFAGQVQAESGMRVIEGRIMEAEVENQDSSEYWFTRAKYYAGRQEDAQAVEAFEKALALAPLDASDRNKAFGRHLILRGYAHYKSTTVGNREALRLLQRELAAAPLDTEYALWLIHGFLDYGWDDTKSLYPDEDILWAYLAARKPWTHIEGRLLKRMVMNGPPNEREAYWARAEELVSNADTSRSLKLGWIMTRTNESARAIPLLKDAVERLPDGHDPNGNDRRAAAFTLFEAYLNTNDWQGAEDIWPVARKRLGPRETPEWLGKIAVAAATMGDKDAALRLWHAKANLDRTDFRHLDELVRLGLKQSLRDFYRRMGEADLTSWVPEAALQLLRTWR